MLFLFLLELFLILSDQSSLKGNASLFLDISNGAHRGGPSPMEAQCSPSARSSHLEMDIGLLAGALGGFLRAMGDFYGVEVFVLANAGRHCLWGCLGTGIVRVASLGEQS